MRSLLVGAAVCCLAVGANLRAADPTQRLRDSQREQIDLNHQTRKVTEQIDAVIDEFSRNGLQGEDVQTLRAIRGVLDKLSEREMAAVASLLREASTAPTSDAARRHASKAFSGQKRIIAQLRQVLSDYHRPQALNDLAQRFARLANRQDINLAATRRLAQLLFPSGNAKRAARFNEDQRALFNVQQVEQASLKDDTAGSLLDLKAFVGSPAGDSELLRKALQTAQDDHLTRNLAAASDALLESSGLLRATDAQRAARDTLRQIATLVAPPQDSLAPLRNAMETITNLILKQEQINNGILNAKPLETDTRQSEVMDQTSALRADVQHASQAAAESLQTAVEKMNAVRRLAGTEHGENNARMLGDQAVAQLKQARAQLAAQLAQDAKKSPADLLAAMEQLKRQVQQLRTEQEADLNKPAARKQDRTRASGKERKLAEQARSLQQAAISIPTAASSLSDAARNMESAVEFLNSGNAPAAAQQERSAVGNLLKAEDALGEHIATLQTAPGDLSQLEAARKELATVIENQAKARLESETASARNEPPAAGLAERQNKLGEDAAAVQQKLPQSAFHASVDLSDAKQNMTAAARSLAKPDAPGARPSQQQAADNLRAAKKELDRQIDDLKQKLGQGTDKSDKLAELVKKLDDAQHKLEEASDKLPLAERAESLQEKQQQLAQGLHKLTEQTPESDHALRQAQQAAQQAANQLAQNSPQEALKSMQQAQEAMQQALQGQQSADTPPGDKQPGDKQPGDKQPGDKQPGDKQPGDKQPGDKQPGDKQPGDKQPGDKQPGDKQPGDKQPGDKQPGDKQPGDKQADGEKSGGKQPRDKQPGDMQPGDKNSGDKQVGDNQPGDKQADGKTSGGKQPGEKQSGGKTSGGKQPGEKQPGGNKPGGMPGGMSDGMQPRGPSLQQLAQQQASLIREAQQDMPQQASANESQAAAPAAPQLADAVTQLQQIGANDQGALPEAAEQALAQAQESATQAAAQAAAGNSAAAQASTSQAQQALAQAQVAAALAQGGSPASSGSSAPSGSSPGQSGKGSSSQASSSPGNSDATNASGGDGSGNTGAVADGGPRRDVAGTSDFQGLPARDRDVLRQSQRRKYPQEYGTQVEKYLKDLADEGSK